MATYKQIRIWVKQKYGFLPKTCWVADGKEQMGIPVRRAWNRINEDRQVPCPDDKIPAIIDALRYFKLIKA
jgi:hypothetical protein